jgi:hypothetical protein
MVAMMPNPNPMITLQMPLDMFNTVQGIVAKRPFDEVADIVLNFRAQVQNQITALRQQEAASREPPSPATRRLHAVSDDNPEVVSEPAAE